MGFTIDAQTNKLELLPDQNQGGSCLKTFAWQNLNATFHNGSRWIQSDVEFDMIKGVCRREVFEPTKALGEISFHEPILSLGWQTG
jgi:hypothetical protein